MKKLAAKSPIVFEILLIIVAFVLALVFGIPCQFIGIENELSVAIGRILAGIVLLIPALIFGLIHLTNAVNGNIAQALVQTGYAVVVGLIFGAIYIRTGDLVSVVIAHAAMDITNYVFGSANGLSTPVLIAFLALLAVEAVYAFVLVLRGNTSGEVTSSQLHQ